MENKEDCIYVMYPTTFSPNTIRQVFQTSFMVSNDEPSLPKEGGRQTFTEEDVQKFGIEKLCEETMKPYSGTSCIVLRIPKAYLGLNPQSGLEMSPILEQIKAGKATGIEKDSFFIKNNLINGVYYPQAGGYISNPNYSPVCDCYGVYTETQKDEIKKKINAGDKSGVYQKMLDLDSRVRSECQNVFSGGISPSLKAELDELYKGEAVRVGIHTGVSDWKENNTSLHRMTDAEFKRAMQNGQNFNM